MSLSIRDWSIDVGRRVDGEPWKLHFSELKGNAPGPCTVFVGGIFGDKPLGCLTVHELKRRLAESDLKGSVVLVPAANPFALSAATRISPDHLYLNRRFPGQPSGFLTDQIAHALFSEISGLGDCVIDLQPGSPTTAMRYVYDYGDAEFTSTFGYLPMIMGRPIEGQLSVAVTRNGGRSLLPEYSGGPVADVSVGVEGSLNVLRARGQLAGPMTGPKRLPVVRRLKFFHPSTAGILESNLKPADVGSRLKAGPISVVRNAATGEILERFELDEDGILLLATTAPATVTPGMFGFMVGIQESEYEVPQL